jgi:hypothetical protein
MCPACITSMVLMAAGATSAGDPTTLAVTKLRAKIRAKKIPREPEVKEKSS